MSLQWPAKDPDEILDYTIDWSARLVTDTIATSVWILDVGITETTQSFTNTPPQSTTIWLSGGTLGASHAITNRITTNGGRTMDQTVKLKIKAR